jgi:hypothetical protein
MLSASSQLLYHTVIPRLILRKKGPFDTLKPVLKSINRGVELAGSLADKQRGRSLLQRVAELISDSALWLKGLPPNFEEERTSCFVS